jgi:hypothetical protein
MDSLIDNILTDLKSKHGLSKIELERIIDSQFKVLQLNIESRKPTSVKMMHLGKFKPSKYLLKITNEQLPKEI